MVSKGMWTRERGEGESDDMGSPKRKQGWWWSEEEKRFELRSHWIEIIYHVGQTGPNNTLHAEPGYPEQRRQFFLSSFPSPHST